jgi:hypothetical protein
LVSLTSDPFLERVPTSATRQRTAQTDGHLCSCETGHAARRREPTQRERGGNRPSLDGRHVTPSR